MKSVFIAGTDTDVGKTVVTSLLYKLAVKHRMKIIVQKLISTGDKTGFSEDLKQIYPKDKLISIVNDKKLAKIVNPYSFKFPASPHFSSELEKKYVRISNLLNSYKKLTLKYDYTIVEGTGGLLVPVNKKILFIDVIKNMKIPVLLVTKNILGTVNHTLSSIDILKKNKIDIKGIIFNNYFNENKNIQNDNIKIIKKFTKINNIFVLDKNLKITEFSKNKVIKIENIF